MPSFFITTNRDLGWQKLRQMRIGEGEKADFKSNKYDSKYLYCEKITLKSNWFQKKYYICI